MIGGYLGDYATSSTVQAWLNTFDGNGASLTSTMTAASNMRVYKDGSTTERASTNGYALTKDFDSVTGIVYCAVDTSDNTDVGFFAAGHDYAIVIQGATINAQTVSVVLATFSIANRTPQVNMTQILGTPVSTPATAGILDVNVKNIVNVAAALDSNNRLKVDADDIGGTAQTGRDLGASVLVAGDFSATMKTSITTAATAATPSVNVASIDGWAAVATGTVTFPGVVAVSGDNMGVSQTTQNQIADSTLRRDFSTARASATGDAVQAKCLLNAGAKLTNRVDASSGTSLVVYDEGGTNPAFTQTETGSSTANPIVALGGGT